MPFKPESRPKKSYLSWLPSWPAFRQKPNEVVIRQLGALQYGPPVPAGPEAQQCWPFAWISQAAYQRTKAGSARRALSVLKFRRDRGIASANAAGADTTALPNVDAVLRSADWRRWSGFPDDGLLMQINATHLRVEVWEHRPSRLLVVAFGGTVFTNIKDWISDLRWFIPYHHDQYTDVVKIFAPAFIAEYERRAALPDGDYLLNVRLLSSGHSLGVGLAQQFAYALPANTEHLRVQKVYAFDPSPGSGQQRCRVKSCC